MRRFKEELNLDNSWENFEADFSHVHELNGVTYVSLLDHFMWNMSLGELVSDCGVLHILENTSDHSPIFCDLTVEDVVNPLPSSNPVKSSPKPSWKLATNDEKESFKAILSDNLNDVRVLENICQDVHCKDSSHIDQIDGYLDDLVYCLENACEAALPTANNGKKSSNKNPRKVAGWNHLVPTSYFVCFLSYIAWWTYLTSPSHRVGPRST